MILFKFDLHVLKDRKVTSLKFGRCVRMHVAFNENDDLLRFPFLFFTTWMPLYLKVTGVVDLF